MEAVASQLSIGETGAVAMACKRSFYRFLLEFWDVIVPEAFVDNWHIKYLCDELQKMAMRVFQGKPKLYDLAINVPPGTTKSTIVSEMFPPWTWTWMPSVRHICGTHTFELGMDLSRRSRDIVIHDARYGGKPTYKDCFGIELRDDQNTKGHFENLQGGMRKSVTVGGKSPTGFHAHFLTVDDPIDPRKALSEAELKNANAWMTDTLPSRVVDKSMVPTILIMQRLHQDDPSARMVERGLRGGKVKHIQLPADCTEYDVKPKELEANYVGGLLDPKRMPRSVLEDIQLRGQYAYAGQYGQSPVPPGGGMFKVERLVIDEAAPSRTFRKTVRYWDKAATGGGGAHTVGVKLGIDSEGVLWVLDVVRGQWDSDVREQVIKSTAELDTRITVIGLEQEPGSGGKESAQATVRRLMGYIVRVDRPTGDKVYRADPFSVQVNQGIVRMARGEWNATYIEELRYFPHSTYKDQVDASAGAFNLLSSVRKKVGALW